jgi:hypothetical protein
MLNTAATMSAGPQDGDGPACAADPMSRLSLLPGSSRLPVMLKALHSRLREKKLRAAKAGRQPRIPRREEKTRAKEPATADRGTLTKPDWERTVF